MSSLHLTRFFSFFFPSPLNGRFAVLEMKGMRTLGHRCGCDLREAVEAHVNGQARSHQLVAAAGGLRAPQPPALLSTGAHYRHLVLLAQNHHAAVDSVYSLARNSTRCG